MDIESLRVPYDQAVSVMTGNLLQEGMEEQRAAVCARLFADASRDGVLSHGLMRFGWMVKWMRSGTIVANAPLTQVSALGGLERWDGGLGPGPWNAWRSMGRAIELARIHGIGCVGLRRTNHWMRAGNYGWQAADAGCIGMCWTNTIALMPAWGGKGRRVGNNPLVLAVPRRDGHVVLDMAMAQYSMGKLGIFKSAGMAAPLPAGFDAQGNETRDPAAILAGGSAMPIGYWKGSGLAILLDLMAAVIGGGSATHQIRAEENEKGVSQVFVALQPAALGSAEEVERIARSIVADVHAAGVGVLYPGQRSLATRRESMELGLVVERKVWERIVAQEY